ncbi:MAG: valine--tRNA ligase [Nanoarchaeota archaeon]|nr:valine--tRNA ligase [Nanoarchaeota archaeon]
MDKSYNKDIENKWQKYWDKYNIYRFDPKSKKKIFSIDVPPPYASAGHLHIGHALHYTQFEIIARFRRMQGYNVYFTPCFDDNGLPTEKYVEEKYNIDKSQISKKEFRELCLKESGKVEKEYADRVFKRLAHSYDWSLLYTTIDKNSQKISQWSFLDLHKKKLAYRSEEPTIWCTHHKTALAQAEIEDVKRQTKLNYIKFDNLTIATTRPELLSSCVGIFVHPDDKRYKKFIGKKIKVPLFNYEVKIMKDEKVDSEFGTGCVMVCTFGDTCDIEWWKKHKLELKVSVDEGGRLNEKAGKYKGLKLKEAREKILEDLDKGGLLVKQEDLEQNVGACWRCNTPVEFIVTKQWFINTLKYKKELINQGRKINWNPDFYRKRYEDWVNNLQWDWCISRQRFFGVPIPVWYCKKCGEVLLPDEKNLPIDPEISKPKKKCKCGSNEFVPEGDVFDTWMTSSMSPEIAVRFDKKLLPMSLRPQSHDIIRTWAFYTILKSYYHFKQIPWKDIAIGTFVLDSKGKGMSKSKKNAIWADEIMEKYDTDTLRYWVGSATFGSDLMFSENEMLAGRRFLTKLWNASKFSLMFLEKYKAKKVKLNKFDEYFLFKLDDVINKATKDYENYKIGDAKKLIDNYFWHYFCDNYLEIAKKKLYEGKDESAKYTLYKILVNILKLYAPIVPHITEEIYSNFSKKSIHISEWCDVENYDKKLEKIGDDALELISDVRKFKAKNNKSLKEPVFLTLDKNKFKDVLEEIKNVVNAEEIKDGEFNVEFVDG